MPIFAMPYFIALVIASGALWFLACQMAPLGYEVSFARVLTAVILMAACVMLIKSFLASVGGPLPGAAVFLVLATLIVKSTLRLSLRSSVSVALVYVVVGLVAWEVISQGK